MEHASNSPLPQLNSEMGLAMQRVAEARRRAEEAKERAAQSRKSLRSMEQWFYTISVALSGAALCLALILFLCHAFGMGDLRSRDSAGFYQFAETVLIGWGILFAFYPLVCEYMGRGYKHLVREAS